MKRSEIVEALEAVRVAHGGILRPAEVVEVARSKSSPLHAEFEWNNGDAAEQWRLAQARMLIRIAVRMIEAPNGARSVTRAYVSLVDDRRDGDSYRASIDVLSDDLLRERLLTQAMRELAAFRRRYNELTELAALFSAMETLRQTA